VSTKKKIVIVIGARPQFIKHAALEIELKTSFTLVSIHTGQHYDSNMSAIFFEQLKINKPNYLLQVGSASHGLQTANMIIEIEKILQIEKPNFLLVYGDTNSTLAGALVASKMCIPIIHIEAGLRSYNKEMPEEINRVMTDHLSEFLFCPTKTAIKNLNKEGLINKIYNVGDIMCDMIRIAKSKDVFIKQNSTSPYYFATIHRPYNTDDLERLTSLIEVFNCLKLKVKFSVHPRTLHLLKKGQIAIEDYSNIEFLEPVSYFDSLNLQNNAEVVITDSGGMQKEAYILNKKCITIRKETEWIETLVGGWNTLVFDDLSILQEELDKKPQTENIPVYGDGNCAQLIKNILLQS
jgi:UDP-GlcNAc3NAcA epimerase